MSEDINRTFFVVLHPLQKVFNHTLHDVAPDTLDRVYIHSNPLIYSKYSVEFRGGSRNFKTGGRGPGAVEFLGLGFALMPLYTYPMLL